MIKNIRVLKSMKNDENIFITIVSENGFARVYYDNGTIDNYIYKNGKEAVDKMEFLGFRDIKTQKK